MSKINRPPISLKRLVTFMNGKVGPFLSVAFLSRFSGIRVDVVIGTLLIHLIWTRTIRLLIVVVVGTVTDDERVYEAPALKVTALRFMETARG